VRRGVCRMRTSLRLVHYEDILDAKDIYSLIALTSFYNKVGWLFACGQATRPVHVRHRANFFVSFPFLFCCCVSCLRLVVTQYYGQCSRAFIRLESMDGLTPAEREAYSDLALQIFVQHPPQDPTTRSHACPSRSCKSSVKDWCVTTQRVTRCRVVVGGVLVVTWTLDLTSLTCWCCASVILPVCVFLCCCFVVLFLLGLQVDGLQGLWYRVPCVHCDWPFDPEPQLLQVPGVPGKGVPAQAHGPAELCFVPRRVVVSVESLLEVVAWSMENLVVEKVPLVVFGRACVVRAVWWSCASAHRPSNANTFQRQERHVRVSCVVAHALPACTRLSCCAVDQPLPRFPSDKLIDTVRQRLGSCFGFAPIVMCPTTFVLHVPVGCLGVALCLCTTGVVGVGVLTSQVSLHQGHCVH